MQSRACSYLLRDLQVAERSENQVKELSHAVLPIPRVLPLTQLIASQAPLSFTIRVNILNKRTFSFCSHVWLVRVATLS